MVEITEEDLQQAKFYHNVYLIINAFVEWKLIPSSVEINYREVNKALELIKGILSIKG